MVNFAELKAKAEKAKDASVARVTNTRDRFSSVPGSKVHWDPNWKRAPPPPPGRAPMGAPPTSVRPVDASGATPPPVVPDSVDARSRSYSPAPPAYTPLPPPTRTSSGYPSSHHEPPAVNRIDWAHLSAEDKEAFFGWLDEFFSRYLGIEVGPGMREQGAALATQPTLAVHRVQGQGRPPVVNMATRPPV